jgi:hypothetical protein
MRCLFFFLKCVERERERETLLFSDRSVLLLRAAIGLQLLVPVCTRILCSGASDWHVGPDLRVADWDTSPETESLIGFPFRCRLNYFRRCDSLAIILGFGGALRTLLYYGWLQIRCAWLQISHVSRAIKYYVRYSRRFLEWLWFLKGHQNDICSCN